MGTEIWDVEIPNITIRCDDASLYAARIAPFPDTGREATGYKTGQILPEDRWAHLIVMRFLSPRPPELWRFLHIWGNWISFPCGGGRVRHVLKTRAVRKKV